MELRQLKYFIGVAEELHFGNASKRLFVSQSALSQQIQILENEIGVDLFVRSKRIHHHKVELTDAGATLLNDARKILQLCQKAVDNTRRVGIKNNVVKLGIFKMVMRERLNQILTLFSTGFPHMEIQIVEFSTAIQVQDALMEETIDIGITHSDTRYNDLLIKTFAEIQVRVVMHTSHPLAGVAAVTPNMLKHEKWVDIQRGINPVYDRTERIFNKVNINRTVVQEVSSYELLCSLVSIGKGIGLVTTSYDINQERNLVSKTIVNNHGQAMSEFIVQYALAYRQDRENPTFDTIIGMINDQ
jgi:DNA-binding transcriptional LysR family regulator